MKSEKWKEKKRVSFLLYFFVAIIFITTFAGKFFKIEHKNEIVKSIWDSDGLDDDRSIVIVRKEWW